LSCACVESSRWLQTHGSGMSCWCGMARHSTRLRRQHPKQLPAVRNHHSPSHCKATPHAHMVCLCASC
jgi:hypothetical protein